MENQTNNEKKVQELKDEMSDKNFELDIDALEDAAGGEYEYVDTYGANHWTMERR